MLCRLITLNTTASSAVSHIKLDVVFGSDECQMSVEEIQILIISCEALLGKPKIFFFQACWGLDPPEGCFIQTDSGGDEHIFLPHDYDVFFGLSTTPDMRSCCFTDIGSMQVCDQSVQERACRAS